MRIVSNKQYPEQQHVALARRYEQVQRPSVALEILRRHLPASQWPLQIVCKPLTFRRGRFVLRVETVTAGGEQADYAFKGYIDGWGAEVMAVCRALARRWEDRKESAALSLPLAYVPEQQVLVSPWVHGRLADIESARDETLQGIAETLARLHQAEVVPEPLTPPRAIVDRILLRCKKLGKKRPETRETMMALMAALEGAVPHLSPPTPVVVHGDLKLEHFVWDGRAWTLLDLDSFGYTDPAYDAGYFLARLHLESVDRPALVREMPHLLEAFRSAYLTAMPTASPHNLAFYYALTLARNCTDVCREHPEEWPQHLPWIVRNATCALRDVVAPPARAAQFACLGGHRI